MSQENIEVVERVYAFFTATADFADFPRDLFAPDAEFDPSDVLPDEGVTHGTNPSDKPEILFRAYAELFDDFVIELERVVAADDQHVVTTVRDGGRLKDSDARITNRFHHAWTFRDGVVQRWSTHLDVGQALAAVGLSES